MHIPSSLTSRSQCMHLYSKLLVLIPDLSKQPNVRSSVVPFSRPLYTVGEILQDLRMEDTVAFLLHLN